MPHVKPSAGSPKKTGKAEKRDGSHPKSDAGRTEARGHSWKSGAPDATDSFALGARTSLDAVAFVERFNRNLGLDSKSAAKKVAHMATDGSKFICAMPALFYSDVAGSFAAASELRATPSPAGILVGDAHLGNLGTFPGPSGEVVWGWVDCDKSGRGRLEWDLDRLATHAVLIARQAKTPPTLEDQQKLVVTLGDEYFQTLRQFLATGARPTGYLKQSELEGPLSSLAKKACQASQKKLDSRQAAGKKFTGPRHASKALVAAVEQGLSAYATSLPLEAPVRRPLQFLAVGLESGTIGGSNSGMEKLLALVSPAGHKGNPVLLKLKQILPPAPEDTSGDLTRSNPARAVENATLLQGFHRPLLGAATVNERQWLVEPEEAEQLILDPAGLKPKELTALVQQAGRVLARSHLQNPSVTSPLIRAWLSDRPDDRVAGVKLAAFALAYADQSEADAKQLGKQSHRRSPTS